MSKKAGDAAREICEAVLDYLIRSQDFTPGEYYGSFWSEKGYHGPLLDYHAGGSHHNRGTGSAALALWMVGKKADDGDMTRKAELAFDWLAARQRPRGGYLEIQNNERPSDWEETGLEECSTIATAFVAHGMGNAVLLGLPHKKLYADCLQRMGHWQLGIEWPPGSGIFPHHERSPYDCLNANLHATETLAVAYAALREITGRALNLFCQGARRSILHTAEVQWPDGCFPYRASGGVTINYTSLVLWCMLNVIDILSGDIEPSASRKESLTNRLKKMAVRIPPDPVRKALTKGTAFLRSCVDRQGALLWDKNETSTAKHNMWTYVLTYNVLMRVGGKSNMQTAARLLKRIVGTRTASGLLPMRDCGEEITECLFMQADMLLFLLPFTDLV